MIAVGQLLTAPFTTTVDQRPGLYVGGIASVIGTLPLLLMPLHVGHDGPMFDAKVKAAGGATCSLIKEGEALLIRDRWTRPACRGFLRRLLAFGRFTDADRRTSDCCRARWLHCL